jgi:RimJ/RimL family protein N-acetyltransferase
MDAVHATLELLKRTTRDAAAALALPVHNRAGVAIGSLLPIGPWLLDDAAQIAAISAWRQRAMRMFLTQFQATPENTRHYLQALSIGEAGRLLWLIIDDRGRCIGHVGLSGATAADGGRAELDNLMRGLDGGDPALIACAEVALLRWAFEVLGLQHIDVRVVSYNWLVIALHEEVGFQTTRQAPLLKRSDNGVTLHDECAAGQANVRYHCTHMALDRARFLALNPVAAAAA